MNYIIAVVGGGNETDASLLHDAQAIGAIVAHAKATLVTGGRGGVMEAASRGAQEAGGLVIGILPGTSRADANPYVDLAIATGLREARNAVIATAADLIVAVGGEHGTLSEIALGLKLRKPVVALRSQWGSITGVAPADTVDQVVQFIHSHAPDLASAAALTAH